MPAGSLGGRTVRVCVETALEILFPPVALVWFFLNFQNQLLENFVVYYKYILSLQRIEFNSHFLTI